ncbi:HpcH/HpaI aldolase family protein [Tessaracoccus palaemonis]|uniref:Aldolase n=1 Tax=Tessaracoccus palaemonis TaxID=2829499 RepID=A0ABX8SEE7_9ACTN|nr:aldolase/citrate lyase family protein [Tessaracoccus palaemonis]QXT61782.1 aldolase [Tessaracoccus palaemonis]
MDHSHGTVARTVARLRDTWAGGDGAYGIWSSIPDASVAELVAASEADYVCIDLQHGVTTFSELPVLAQVMRGAGRAPIVRVPWKDGAEIMRALDCGAAGVVVPMVSTAEEAASAVAACRFPPHGVRSWGPMFGYVRSDGAPSPAEQDSTALCLVMIETAEGVANLDAIVATPGLDGVYIGPNDLALACGLGRRTYRDSEEVAALIQRVVDACRQRGIAVGLHCSDPAMGEDWVERGVSMVTIAQDTGLLQQAVGAAVRAARGGEAGAVPTGPAPY